MEIRKKLWQLADTTHWIALRPMRDGVDPEKMIRMQQHRENLIDEITSYVDELESTVGRTVSERWER